MSIRILDVDERGSGLIQGTEYFPFSDSSTESDGRISTAELKEYVEADLQTSITENTTNIAANATSIGSLQTTVNDIASEIDELQETIEKITAVADDDIEELFDE